MKILITGGAGYIGSILVELLLNSGHKVIVFDNLLFKQNSLLPHFINPNFEFIKGDVRDTVALADAVRGVDAVVHLAAIVGAPACDRDHKLADAVNVEGTKNLIAVTSPGQAILYASTGSNYGKVDGICTEDTPLNPLSVYGITKTKAEEMIMQRGNSLGYRFATAFGLSPRLRLDLLPNDFVYQALKAKTLIIYERHVRRTFIHVRDIARALVYAIENFANMKNEVYNCGSNSMNCSKEDVARMIQRHVDYYLHFAEVGSDPDKRDYEVSYDKIKEKGFETTIDMNQGIIELIKGIRTVPGFNPYTNIIHE